jgi:hypothetical protein
MRCTLPQLAHPHRRYHAECTIPSAVILSSPVLDLTDATKCGHGFSAFGCNGTNRFLADLPQMGLGLIPTKTGRNQMSLLNGGEVILGAGLLVLLWAGLSLIGRQNLKKQRVPSALGMALLPVTFLTGIVGGIVLILHGVGML